jgi:hypothetical protein
MTARRSLVVLAGLALGPTPACLHISGNVTPPPEPPAPRREFASLPSRPGEAVRTNPVPVSPGSHPGLATADPPASVSRRPAEPDVEPPAVAPAPPAPITAVRAEPGPLPALPSLSPQPPAAEPPLVAALRAYVEDRPYDAIRHLDGLDRVNQELALQLLPQFARLARLNLSAADPREVGVMADQFRAAADRLAALAPLTVEKLAFCKEVDGFGRYVPRPEAEPYRPRDRTALYLELGHVACEPSPGPKGEGFVTRLQVTFEVRDAGGRVVEQADPADPRRRIPVVRLDHVIPTRSPVRDYFRTYGMAVPTQPGVYTLTAEVRDLATNRTARSRPVEFRVAGP